LSITKSWEPNEIVKIKKFAFTAKQFLILYTIRYGKIIELKNNKIKCKHKNKLNRY
jgi:hypothetical protein